ncbi:AAA family ATPase [Bergeyella cardium]|uniref:AAA family ATPase n=1 Tax=Bergeyella cardium TaxID=1585976 RepID=UPI000EA357C5|nr:AAA family ATPase [Bergeyella cardium]
MKKIYIKNYKGFEEQVIELKEINFFVGENSTGKTSILKLINIINSKEFWFNEQFNNSEVELGYFDEIINRNSSDLFFRIGIEVPYNEKGSIRRVLLEFKDYKSIPKISQIKYQTETTDFLMKITKKQIHYRTRDLSNSSFLNWCQDFNYSEKYNRIDIPQKLPLFILFSFLEDRLAFKNKRVTMPFAAEPLLYKRYIWLAPIRAKAKRIYESYEVKFSPEGEHIPSLLKELFANSKKKESARILQILNQFGRESNLYDELCIKNYGVKTASPFEIVVKYDDTEIKLPNVGYGVSQCLPLIVEILSSKDFCFSIQQPEVHLHPKAQAAFGSFLFNAAKKDNNTFLIETHSDFTINRFRYRLSKEGKSGVNSQVIFFEREKHTNRISHLEINSDGSFTSEVPSSYRDFFIDEELKLLEL